MQWSNGIGYIIKKKGIGYIHFLYKLRLLGFVDVWRFMRYLSYNIKRYMEEAKRWVKSSNITKKILATTQKTKIGLLGRSKWNLTNT